MKPITAPTSPKFELEKQTAEVWSSTRRLVPHPRIPWVPVVALAMIFSIIFSAGWIVLGLWFLRAYPDHPWAKWLPTNQTTVLQTPATDIDQATPAAVVEVASLLQGLASSRGAKGIYPPASITGQAVALSNNGWLLTVLGATPATGTRVSLPRLGPPLAVSKTVNDPASAFVFIKAETQDLTPVTFAESSELAKEQPVWVVSQRSGRVNITSHRLIATYPTTWRDSDQQLADWQLDPPAEDALGSAVFLANGHLVGLVGANRLIWSTTNLSSTVDQIIRTDTVTRPAAGFRYYNTNDYIVTVRNDSGILIGSEGNEAAVAPKSAAEKAGLRTGDIITAVNDRPVDQDWITLVSRYTAGADLKLTVRRGTATKNFTLTLGVLRP